MIEIQDGNASLTRVEHRDISKPVKPLTVGELELKLLARFPRADAEPWDRMGLLVGDPAALVTGVAVALDPTSEALEKARAAGANVLLTHHPAFLDPPGAISPSHLVAPTPGVTIWNAVANGVALMNFHTALDVSAEAVRLLPRMLNLDFEGILVPQADDPDKGYGQICRVRASEGSFKLAHLAARCTSVFGRSPRTWGDFSEDVKSVVIANGSAGNVVDACCAAHIDCLVCGEIGYHVALNASQAGLSVVELGHDASELPLTAILAQAAVDAGVASEDVSVIDQSRNWQLTDATRI